jgi:hypothetical protein
VGLQLAGLPPTKGETMRVMDRDVELPVEVRDASAATFDEAQPAT